MKKTLLVVLILSLFSCHKKEVRNNYRTDFSKDEQHYLAVADSIIKSAYYATLITLDANNQPRARIVEPFLPKAHYVIWIATNPKTRKVQQLKNNPTTTLHYFDKTKLAYVSLMGEALLINDDETKERIWKAGWERFYPNKKTDYLLIKFIPRTIELISIADNLTGDKTTWKPHQIQLYH